MTHRDENEQLLTREQAAHFLNVSPRTIDYWRKPSKARRRRNRPVLPFVKLGYAIRFIPADLRKFVEERRVGRS